MGTRFCLIILKVLLLCVIFNIATADTPGSLKASTFSNNISEGYYEKSETLKYSTYSGGSACCPPGRTCEFDPDFGSCICNPSEYDPYCMYDGCEEVTIKGRKKCSCPCKGYMPLSNNKKTNPLSEPLPVTTPKPIKTSVSSVSDIGKTDKRVKEESFVNLNIQIFSENSLIYNSNEDLDRNISVQSGAKVKFEIACIETNIPGEMSIQEKGRTLSYKHVSKGGTQNLSFAFQALKNKELSVVFSDVENKIIFGKEYSIAVEKPEPEVVPTHAILPEKTISPQNGLTAVISSKKNSVIND